MDRQLSADSKHTPVSMLHGLAAAGARWHVPGALAMVAALIAPAVSSASPLLDLDLEVPPGCPAPAMVERAVERLVQKPPAVPLHVSAHLVQLPDHWQLRASFESGARMVDQPSRAGTTNKSNMACGARDGGGSGPVHPARRGARTRKSGGAAAAEPGTNWRVGVARYWEWVTPQLVTGAERGRALWSASTKASRSGHSQGLEVLLPAEPKPSSDEPERAVPRLSFAELYKSHFALVWRNRRRLGVPEARLRDAAQDAFLVVHRRLSEFEGRGTVEAWLWSAAQPELSRSAQPV